MTILIRSYLAFKVSIKKWERNTSRNRDKTENNINCNERTYGINFFLLFLLCMVSVGSNLQADGRNLNALLHFLQSVFGSNVPIPALFLNTRLYIRQDLLYDFLVCPQKNIHTSNGIQYLWALSKMPVLYLWPTRPWIVSWQLFA